MPAADCGFPDLPGDIRSKLLVEVGPTIPVEIGYDPGYDEFVDAKPALSPDLYPALVDTGASGNSVDDELAISLRLPIIYYEWEVSGSAGIHTVNVYLAQSYVPELTRTISGQFVGVHLAAGGQLHRAIIGRSFLSDFALFYDGRTGAVTLSDD